MVLNNINKNDSIFWKSSLQYLLCPRILRTTLVCYYFNEGCRKSSTTPTSYVYLWISTGYIVSQLKDWLHWFKHNCIIFNGCRVGPTKPVNHTSWADVTTSTDRPQVVNNLYVMEYFRGVPVLTLIIYDLFCCYRGVCNGTGSSLFSVLSYAAFVPGPLDYSIEMKNWYDILNGIIF